MNFEETYLPWQFTLPRLRYYITKVETKPAYRLFEEYLHRLIRPLYVKLNAENSQDTWLDKKIRPNVVRFSCSIFLADCLLAANTAFTEWKTSGNNT